MHFRGADCASFWVLARTPAERDRRLALGKRFRLSGRLEEIDSVRRRARRGAGGQAQIGEDSHDHRRILDGSDDLQGIATIRVVFDVDLENPLE